MLKKALKRDVFKAFFLAFKSKNLCVLCVYVFKKMSYVNSSV